MLVWKGNYYKKGTTECYVMFHHSLWGLGHSTNKHFCVCAYKGPACEVCVWKKQNGMFRKCDHTMSKLCVWLSTLPDAACWGNPQSPIDRRSSFCGCAFWERFDCFIKSLKKQFKLDICPEALAAGSLRQWNDTIPTMHRCLMDRRYLIYLAVLWNL